MQLTLPLVKRAVWNGTVHVGAHVVAAVRSFAVCVVIESSTSSLADLGKHDPYIVLAMCPRSMQLSSNTLTGTLPSSLSALTLLT